MEISKFLDPKNEVAFRKVFGSEEHQDILIHFINDILELKGGDQIEEVECITPIQDFELPPKKLSIVNVLCRAQNGVHTIIEMQVAQSIVFEKKEQGRAKAYFRELGSDGENKNKGLQIKGLICITIADCIVFPDKEGYMSEHEFVKPANDKKLRETLSIFVELPKFKKNKIEELENMLEKWCYYFKYATQTSEADLEKIIGPDLVIKKAYEALNQLNWSESELIAYEEEKKGIRQKY